MNLADELMRGPVRKASRGEIVQLEERPTRLPFNGQLSPDEWRLLHQGAFSGPQSWESA